MRAEGKAPLACVLPTRPEQSNGTSRASSGRNGRLRAVALKQAAQSGNRLSRFTPCDLPNCAEGTKARDEMIEWLVELDHATAALLYCVAQTLIWLIGFLFLWYVPSDEVREKWKQQRKEKRKWKQGK